jgi:geranylgeranyl diphosphate synthase, type II
MQNGPTPDLKALLSKLIPSIDSALDRYTAAAEGCPARLTEAIRYSVLAAGKRLRPILVLWACEASCGDHRRAMPAACAVEFIHVYSLIHDDLPAMDDDHLRRGQPTCHIQFDEATAILAGDSLQMLAIQTLCDELPENIAWRCCQILAKLAGRCHLVGGQVDDLSAEGRFGEVASMTENPMEFLKAIHRRKTSALIEASLQMGGVVGQANSQQLQALSTFGQAIGLAFQIVDDCLDVESTSDHLGKSTRKDHKTGKLTYPGLVGLTASRQMAEELISQATNSLSVFGAQATKLKALARYVVDRKN